MIQSTKSLVLAITWLGTSIFSCLAIAIEESGVFKYTVNFIDDANIGGHASAQGTLFLTEINGQKVLVGDGHTLVRNAYEEKLTPTKAVIEVNGTEYNLGTNVQVHEEYIADSSANFSDLSIWQIPPELQSTMDGTQPLRMNNADLTPSDLSLYNEYVVMGYPNGNPRRYGINYDRVVLEPYAGTGRNVISIYPDSLGVGFSGGPMLARDAQSGRWEVIGTVSGGSRNASIITPVSENKLLSGDFFPADCLFGK